MRTRQGRRTNRSPPPPPLGPSDHPGPPVTPDCIRYIEISKTRIGGADGSADPEAALMARRTLIYALDSCLRLLHPFMPFLTEELWQRLPHDGPSLMISHWPQSGDEPLPVDEAALAQFGSLQGLVRSIRNARAEYRVEPSKKVAAKILTTGATPLPRPHLLDPTSSTPLLAYPPRLDEPSFAILQASPPLPGCSVRACSAAWQAVWRRRYRRRPRHWRCSAASTSIR